MNEMQKNYPASMAINFGSRLKEWTNSLPGISRTLLEATAVLLISFAFLAVIQFSTPDMPDNDGYYHIKMAYLMRTEGLKPDFTWLPLTILNVREFYDHHFLFHVGLILFTFGDLRLGAKWAAVLFASLAILSVWWLLYRQRVRYSWLWAFGLLAVSEAFIYRMSITRAQSLSLAVLVLGLHFVLTRQYRWLLPLGFTYVWLYDAFPLLFALSGIYTAASWMIDRRLELRPMIYSGAGIVLGLVINPYFPDNIVFAVRHMLPKLVETTSVSVGNEWYPYTTLQLLQNSPLSLAVFFLGVLMMGLTASRMSLKTATGLLLVILSGLMLLQARRFIEYFPAFALIFAAFSWTDFRMDETRQPEEVRDASRESESSRGEWLRKCLLPGIQKLLPAGIMFCGLCFGMAFTLKSSMDSIQDSKPYSMFSGASNWLVENTPRGSQVFQTDWDDFPRLFFFNTHNTYLVGLDPTYLQLYNSDLYNEWVAITQGEIEQPSALISEKFSAQYVVSDLRHKDFLSEAGRDDGLREVYRDDFSVVYQVVVEN